MYHSEEGLTISNAGLMTHMENHLALLQAAGPYRTHGRISHECQRKGYAGRIKKAGGRNYPHKSGDHQHGAAEDPLKCSESLFSTESLIKCTKMDEQIR